MTEVIVRMQYVYSWWAFVLHTRNLPISRSNRCKCVESRPFILLIYMYYNMNLKHNLKLNENWKTHLVIYLHRLDFEIVRHVCLQYKRPPRIRVLHTYNDFGQIFRNVQTEVLFYDFYLRWLWLIASFNLPTFRSMQLFWSIRVVCPNFGLPVLTSSIMNRLSVMKVFQLSNGDLLFS